MKPTEDPYAHLSTEQANPASENLDRLTPGEFVDLMQSEDRRVLEALGQVREDLAFLIEELARRFRSDGRLFYSGAGTSGRLGMLDAVECPPTFGSSPDRVQALLAGGYECLVRSVEGAEDDSERGRQTVAERGISSGDMVVGIAASGATPFVRGTLLGARDRGAFTVFVTCHESPEIEPAPDRVVVLATGPEVLTGSTRLKAGTAQKLFLNRLTTGAMIQSGKVYKNRMVDLFLSCDKLRERAIRTTRWATDLSREDAIRLLGEVGGSVKVAILVHRLGLSPDEAIKRLDMHDGKLRDSLEKR